MLVFSVGATPIHESRGWRVRRDLDMENMRSWINCGVIMTQSSFEDAFSIFCERWLSIFRKNVRYVMDYGDAFRRARDMPQASVYAHFFCGVRTDKHSVRDELMRSFYANFDDDSVIGKWCMKRGFELHAFTASDKVRMDRGAIIIVRYFSVFIKII